jgi:hypothetical protein
MGLLAPSRTRVHLGLRTCLGKQHGGCRVGCLPSLHAAYTVRGGGVRIGTLHGLGSM